MIDILDVRPNTLYRIVNKKARIDTFVAIKDGKMYKAIEDKDGIHYLNEMNFSKDFSWRDTDIFIHKE